MNNLEKLDWYDTLACKVVGVLDAFADFLYEDKLISLDYPQEWSFTFLPQYQKIIADKFKKSKLSFRETVDLMTIDLEWITKRLKSYQADQAQGKLNYFALKKDLTRIETNFFPQVDHFLQQYRTQFQKFRAEVLEKIALKARNKLIRQRDFSSDIETTRILLQQSVKIPLEQKTAQKNRLNEFYKHWGSISSSQKDLLLEYAEIKRLALLNAGKIEADKAKMHKSVRDAAFTTSLMDTNLIEELPPSVLISKSQYIPPSFFQHEQDSQRIFEASNVGESELNISTSYDDKTASHTSHSSEDRSSFGSANSKENGLDKSTDSDMSDYSLSPEKKPKGFFSSAKNKLKSTFGSKTLAR